MKWEIVTLDGLRVPMESDHAAPHFSSAVPQPPRLRRLTQCQSLEYVPLRTREYVYDEDCKPSFGCSYVLRETDERYTADVESMAKRIAIEYATDWWRCGFEAALEHLRRYIEALETDKHGDQETASRAQALRYARSVLDRLRTTPPPMDHEAFKSKARKQLDDPTHPRLGRLWWFDEKYDAGEGGGA